MTKLSEAISNRQKDLRITDAVSAEQVSALYGEQVKQQTFSTWKSGVVPRAKYWPALAAWTGLSEERFAEIANEAMAALATSSTPYFVGMSKAAEHGKIADRKDGKYRFEPYKMGRKRIPEGRYTMSVDTKVMEPVFHVGTQIWVDPAKPPAPGNEVVVHSGGFGWIGALDTWDGRNATLLRANSDPVTVQNVEAIHVIVLSSRI
ncbi:hypothetical protein [Shinella sp.]|uniref:S24 family peptidase n=1 Tax=Shinella sp. TaxID=1870904 RepID=UPI00289B7085|nr:hypothetical protein [Shinella sp.]